MTTLPSPSGTLINKSSEQNTFVHETPRNNSSCGLAAVLVLADGTCFTGCSIGFSGSTVGEVVFNTAMTGYQEILSDPSYTKQIVTLTYPHIGSTGCTPVDMESSGAFAAGLVIRDLPLLASSWRSKQTLPEFLQQHKVVAIADIDTRRLTRHLRQHGAMAGSIITANAADEPIDTLKARAGELVQTFPGLAGMDLAQEVSCSDGYGWDQSCWRLAIDDFPRSVAGGAGGDAGSSDVSAQPDLPADAPLVVAMDFGVKHNILRMLHQRGCRIQVVPAKTSAAQILSLSPAGVFLSNGPGDPEPCDYAIDTIRTLLDKNLPIFGICLGHQLLALASGAKTVKMKFGHHGANHPVLDHASGKVMISSQNHGFAVDPDSLDNNLSVTHTSLFDGSIQGIEHSNGNAFGFQGHPEASPGPHDVATLFDRFVGMM